MLIADDGRESLHAVDALQRRPRYTARDELLAAAAHRVIGLHIAAIEAADSQVAEPVAPGGLADLTGDALYDWATRQRTRCLLP